MEQLSIFNEHKKIKVSKNKLPIILSASRMTDLPKFYPAELIEEVQKRLDKGITIHTLVLWSKHPDALLNTKLYKFINTLIKDNIQIYFQCTISGMGGSFMEPYAPPFEKALDDLKNVVNLIGSERINLRIDPLIRMKNMDTQETFSKLKYFMPIVKKASTLGIKRYTMSFLESNMHKKVDKRLTRLGWNIISPNSIERLKTIKWLKNISKKYNVTISSCCVPELPESKCIDGYLLQKLHPLNLNARLDEPRSRTMCGCTHSIDIGGWPPKKCFTGCIYCYANPIDKH